MNKLTKKIGWSASVAFALMFATSVNVVAQEKVVTSDNVEVKESVEAIALAGTVQELNVQWALNKAQNNAMGIEVMKEPAERVPATEPSDVVSRRVNLPWHFTGGLLDSPTEADNYQSGATTNCPSGTDTVCVLNAPDDGSGQPDMEAEVEVDDETFTIEQRIIEAITSGSTNETVTDLRSN